MATSEAPELIGLAQRTLRDLRLRVAGASGGGPDALREAGYAGATSLFDAFETWLDDRGSNRAEDLAIDQFSSRAAEFFQAAGWGRVSFRSLHDALAVIDIADCWESQLHGQGETGCHLTTGTLAGFLGCLADYPVAVMEIECGSSTSSRCRFLAGNAEMLEHAYERLSRGEEWETIGAGEF
ncbi:MAG TPA: 4-vinyl reductase [Gemmatimonadaceae bacterium]|jgi:predicted hydrocarbon binding protein|nr:4-vinyl reductase [Gemmatimonadaceae bacterium]